MDLMQDLHNVMPPRGLGGLDGIRRRIVRRRRRRAYAAVAGVAASMLMFSAGATAVLRPFAQTPPPAPTSAPVLPATTRIAPPSIEADGTPTGFVGRDGAVYERVGGGRLDTAIQTATDIRVPAGSTRIGVLTTCGDAAKPTTLELSVASTPRAWQEVACESDTHPALSAQLRLPVTLTDFDVSGITGPITVTATNTATVLAPRQTWTIAIYAWQPPVQVRSAPIAPLMPQVSADGAWHRIDVRAGQWPTDRAALFTVPANTRFFVYAACPPVLASSSVSDQTPYGDVASLSLDGQRRSGIRCRDEMIPSQVWIGAEDQTGDTEATLKVSFDAPPMYDDRAGNWSIGLYVAN
jgi:hypothetical protein